MKAATKKIGQSSGDVFRDLGYSAEESLNLALRSELMMQIEKIVAKSGLSQREAAKRFGITQPRLNDLLRGQIQKFSLDALVNMLAAAGATVEMRVRNLATKGREPLRRAAQTRGEQRFTGAGRSPGKRRRKVLKHRAPPNQVQPEEKYMAGQQDNGSLPIDPDTFRVRGWAHKRQYQTEYRGSLADLKAVGLLSDADLPPAGRMQITHGGRGAPHRKAVRRAGVVDWWSVTIYRPTTDEERAAMQAAKFERKLAPRATDPLFERFMKRMLRDK